MASGLWAFWPVGLLTCEVLSCGAFELWGFWPGGAFDLEGPLTCGALDLWGFWSCSFWPMLLLTSVAFDLWGIWPMGPLTCGAFDLWCLWSVKLLTCGAFDLWGLWPVGLLILQLLTYVASDFCRFWPVGPLTCGASDLCGFPPAGLPTTSQPIQYLDVYGETLTLQRSLMHPSEVRTAIDCQCNVCLPETLTQAPAATMAIFTTAVGHATTKYFKFCYDERNLQVTSTCASFRYINFILSKFHFYGSKLEFDRSSNKSFTLNR